MPPAEPVAAILIGRNEGERLVRALAAATRDCAPVIYVDSGSTDGSVAAAERAGACVVALDMSRPFTAARARNEGFAALNPAPGDLVQFIDGDCELREGWIDTGRDFLNANPQAAIAAGRVRERFPDASVYNRLCDAEWATPIGKADAVGGIFLIRADDFRAVGGFDPALIAGEEPDLCARLRAQGREVWRLDHEMVWHDAAMTRFSQFWTRARRGGHAAAEGAARHDGAGEGAQVRRALIWGATLPLAILLAAMVTRWALLAFLIYPVQVARLAQKRGWEWAFFNTLSKFAEARGVIRYHWGRLTRQRQGLIEYKGNQGGR